MAIKPDPEISRLGERKRRRRHVPKEARREGDSMFRKKKIFQREGKKEDFHSRPGPKRIRKTEEGGIVNNKGNQGQLKSASITT